MEKFSIILCTVASNDYLHYLERLLASAKKNLTEALFYVVLVNVDKKKDEYFRMIYNNIEIKHDYIYFKNLNEQRGYCTNRRASILPLIATKFKSPIAWIDADSLFISRADDLIFYSRQYDLSVMYREDNIPSKSIFRKIIKKPKGPLGTPYQGVFSAGVIITNNSSVMKEFLNRYSDIVSQKPLSWFADQEGLYLTYLEYKSRINFHNLPVKYRSRIMNKDTIIWVPKTYYRDNSEFWRIGEKILHDQLKWPSPKIITQSDIAYGNSKKYFVKDKVVKFKNKILNLLKNYLKNR